jgi:glycine dehydrogenase subunit 1
LNPYIANTAEDTKAMLDVIGVRSIDDLFADIQPRHRPRSFDLPAGQSEQEVVDYVRRLAAMNAGAGQLTLFVGAGYYDHYIPPAVDALISRGEFFTAYTPYQPECSQGTLQALYEYQSSLCTLTGMEAANASLYDGGTALYEAVMMALRVTGRRRIVMDGGVNPIFRTILRSYTTNLDIEFIETPVVHGQCDRNAVRKALNDATAAVILQNPNFFGAVDDHTDLAVMAHEKGALLIESVYPVSLGLLKTPAAMGADIVTGEGQSLGLPLNFGGPYLGFMATRKEFIRKMPGRIVGQTVDSKGRRCFVNTLQAREQHIRREKATSNICTNVSLCALRALIYMTLLGKEGLKDLSRLIVYKAEYLKEQLSKIKGVEVKLSSPTFNEFTVCFDRDAATIVEKMIAKGFAAGFPIGRYYSGMDNYMIIAVTERRTKEDMDRYVKALSEVLQSR